MTRVLTVKVEESGEGEELEVRLEGGPLTPDELGPVMAELLHASLGDEPSIGNIVKIQQTMIGALNQ